MRRITSWLRMIAVVALNLTISAETIAVIRGVTRTYSEVFLCFELMADSTWLFSHEMSINNDPFCLLSEFSLGNGKDHSQNRPIKVQVPSNNTYPKQQIIGGNSRCDVYSIKRIFVPFFNQQRQSSDWLIRTIEYQKHALRLNRTCGHIPSSKSAQLFEGIHHWNNKQDSNQVEPMALSCSDHLTIDRLIQSTSKSLLQVHSASMLSWVIMDYLTFKCKPVIGAKDDELNNIVTGIRYKEIATNKNRLLAFFRSLNNYGSLISCWVKIRLFRVKQPGYT